MQLKFCDKNQNEKKRLDKILLKIMSHDIKLLGRVEFEKELSLEEIEKVLKKCQEVYEEQKIKVIKEAIKSLD